MPRQKTFYLDIITPHGIIFSEKVVHVNAPGKNGRFGILVNHIPSMILLDTGQVAIQAITENRIFTISGGMAKVKNNHMKIVTPAAEDFSTIDTQRAKRAKARAEKRLASQKNVDSARAKRALSRAENRLNSAHPHQH